jgi:hypothetical protein
VFSEAGNQSFRRLATMRRKYSYKRTDAESQAFKAKIVSLRVEGRSITEIARALVITKQYVSLVLNEAGLRGRAVKGRPFGRVQADSDDNDEVQATIAELQRQGHYILADRLRVMLERRAAAIELREAIRRANRKPT